MAGAGARGLMVRKVVVMLCSSLLLRISFLLWSFSFSNDSHVWELTCHLNWPIRIFPWDLKKKNITKREKG